VQFLKSNDILYTGEHAYTHDGWITILPLDRLRTST